MIKAIITDLDRTLLHTDKTLSQYTVDVMRQCHEKGIVIMTATARPERSIQKYHQQICFDAAAVMNGAQIILPDSVLENGISPASAKQILTELIAIPDTFISIETSEGIFSSADIPEWECIYYDGFPEIPTQGTLYKILASSKEKALYDRVENILTGDVYHTIANGYLVQIMSRAATKWNGINEMLKALNVPVHEVIYFGDDNDDIEPIRICGIGVAVANAIKAVINEADYTAGSNDEDGVAHFIEENILSN